MLWFLDTRGDAWPATTGPLRLVTGQGGHVMLSRAEDVGAVLFSGTIPDATAVHAALLGIIAVQDWGLVECRVRTGARGQREALAWLRGNSTTTCTVEVAPEAPSGGHSESPASGGDAC